MKKIKTIFLAALAAVSALALPQTTAGADEADNFMAGYFYEAFSSVDGKIVEKKGVGELFDYANGEMTSKQTGYSTLLLTDVCYQNYVVSFEYLSTANEVVLVSKQSVAGQSISYDGLGATVQTNGRVKFGGMSDISGSYGTSATVSGYNKANWHKVSVKVYGLSAEMFVDDVSTAKLTLPGFWETSVGYIGLQTNGSGTAFRNFSLQGLDHFGKEEDYYFSKKIKRIACIGDSITVGAYGDKVGANNYPYDVTKTYPAYLQGMLGAGATVKNFGISGITMTSYDTQVENALAIGFKADVALIMLGTNDYLMAGWPKAKYIEKYEQLIADLQKSNPATEIIVMTSPTYYGDAATDAAMKTALIATQKELAEKHSLKVIDMHEATVGIGDKYIEDGLHPYSEGNKIMAQAVYDEIAKDWFVDFTMVSSLTLSVGESVELENDAVFLPTFKSSSPAVAEVSAEGVVTAKKAGKSVITVTLGKFSGRCIVVVKEAPDVSDVSVEGKVVYGEQPVLKCNASVEGEIKLAEGQDIKAGTHTYAWVFTPSDDDYSIVEGQIEITVEKAIPRYEIPVLPSVEAGTKLSAIALPEGFAFVNGEETLKEGVNKVSVKYMPIDSENYEEVIFDMEITASKKITSEQHSSASKKGCGNMISFYGISAVGLVGVLCLRKKKD